jgi:epoxyqueuosine reductase
MDEAVFPPREGVHGAELIELLGMDQREFSRRFKNSTVKRTKRRGLLRNVAVALGNWGSPEAVPALAAALHVKEPLVRGHAAWALGRIASGSAASAADSAVIAEALLRRLAVEEDAWVRVELSDALASRRPQTRLRRAVARRAASSYPLPPA